MTTNGTKRKASTGKTIGLVRQYTYGFTRCLLCGYRKEWHAVLRDTDTPTSTALHNVKRWAAEAGWTQDRRHRYICPKCSRGDAPVRTIADVNAQLQAALDMAKAMGADTDHMIAYMAGASSALLTDGTEAEADEDEDAPAQLKESDAIRYVYHMLSAAQKARSNTLEAYGVTDEADDVLRVTLADVNPWLFGKNDIITGLTRVIRNYENDGTLAPLDFYNLVTIATKVSRGDPAIGILAELPFTQARMSWVSGWLPED